MQKIRNTIDYKNIILYSTQNKKIYFEDILDKLKEAGIKKGDIIFIHSDISVFGKIGDVRDKNVFLGLLFEAFKEAVGKNGTIIMPTFTYSFCRKEPYDLDASPSTVGVFTEYFRKQKGVVRTNDPIFSVAVWGKFKNFFISNLGKECFGENSIFDKLRQKNARIILFGVPESTFVHYVERKCNVPYRFHKFFSGKIINKGRVCKATYDYFARPLDGSAEMDLSRLNESLINRKIMKKTELGAGEILSVKAKDLFCEGIKALKRNPYFFLKKNFQKHD